MELKNLTKNKNNPAKKWENDLIREENEEKIHIHTHTKPTRPIYE